MSSSRRHIERRPAINIGDAVRKRADEIDGVLPDKEKQLDVLQDEVKGMRQERRELARVLRQIDGSVNTGPAVTDEQVLEAVKKLGGEEICGMAVAQELGVTLRNVARKLRKLVDDGALTGNPGDGYSVIKVAA